MISKAQLLSTINDLPDKFSIDEILDKIMFLHKVQVGMEQSANGDTTPHDQVKEEFKKWLK